jgi:hypothetical protein
MLLRACNTELHALQPVTEDDVFSTDATHEREVELLFRKPGPLGMKLKPDKVKSLHSVQSVHAVGQAMDWCTTVRMCSFGLCVGPAASSPWLARSVQVPPAHGTRGECVCCWQEREVEAVKVLLEPGR